MIFSAICLAHWIGSSLLASITQNGTISLYASYHKSYELAKLYQNSLLVENSGSRPRLTTRSIAFLGLTLK
ncbi:hypothetical protein FFR91_01760 [Mycoplasma mycoides subsp. mycoides]|nr:hypothetical protein [Mycoplasma mycoides]TNJ31269.1 hypothetical protein FFR90_01760 [Mycoplasma mycoides subsp. mycoides]TNJ32037.1 hypothetical protein FFR91_01760 [Mycoplasma mycoides subsp. mycoides]BCU84212.1 hypothetical protein mmcaprivi_05910 [Mycoplasma mycoides]